MVSKNQLKFISSLHLKKNRIANQLFIAEGVKVIQELIDANYKLNDLFTTQNDFSNLKTGKTHAITQADLKKISALTTPNTCLATFSIPENIKIELNIINCFEYLLIVDSILSLRSKFFPCSYKNWR